MFLKFNRYTYDQRWKNQTSQKSINKTSYAICKEIQYDKKCNISLNLVNDEIIKKINMQHRKKNKSTNVVSLSYFKKSELYSSFIEKMTIGDIFISFDTMIKESMELKVKKKEYFMHLLVHGTLHIFGLDHDNNQNAYTMESLEGKIMQEIGLKNPYNSYIETI